MRLLSSVLIFPLPKIASFYGTSNERVSLSRNGTADELPKRKIIAAPGEQEWDLAISHKARVQKQHRTKQNLQHLKKMHFHWRKKLMLGSFLAVADWSQGRVSLSELRLVTACHECWMEKKALSYQIGSQWKYEGDAERAQSNSHNLHSLWFISATL